VKKKKTKREDHTIRTRTVKRLWEIVLDEADSGEDGLCTAERGENKQAGASKCRDSHHNTAEKVAARFFTFASTF
jgi:hypothetical protein